MNFLTATKARGKNTSTPLLDSSIPRRTDIPLAMSFGRSSTFTTSTPVQNPPSRSLYPSLNLQTPATPTPSNPPSQHQQPLQQKPPPRPASVPLSFGGGLSHSASTPALSQTFQNNIPAQQQQHQQQDPFGAQQPFSPAPQPPLTTFDLGGNTPFAAKQGLQWGGGGGQLGGHGLTRSHSQQFMPQPLGGAAGGAGGNPLVENGDTFLVIYGHTHRNGLLLWQRNK